MKKNQRLRRRHSTVLGYFKENNAPFEVRILKVLDQQWSIRVFFCKKTISTALDFKS